MKIQVIAAILMVAASLTSCRGFRPGMASIKDERPDTAMIHKLELEEEVLCALDSLTMEYAGACADGFLFGGDEEGGLLTEKERKLRPEYLMDPSVVEGLLTVQQKLGALAILIPENSIRKVYGMPMEESEAALVRLSSDLNLPEFGTPQSLIASLKEQGLLNYYWYMEEIMMTECLFLISRNIEPFMRSISDEELLSLHKRISLCEKAASEYSNYDPAIAEVLEIKERIIPHSGIPEDADAATFRADFRNILEQNAEAYSRLRNEFLPSL